MKIVVLVKPMGADRAVHLTDRGFAVADTIGRSRRRTLAIEKEGADLVSCGRRTVNRNERSPIFAAADVGLVDDWDETLPGCVGAFEGQF